MLTSDITNLINQGVLQTPYRTPSPDLDKNGFLQLLIKQMSMQDPLEPMGNSEFISQLSQISSLEQAMNLNTSITQMLSLQQLTQGSSLLGKTVIALVQADDGTISTVTGTVDQVMMLSGNAYVKLSTGDEVPISSVISVEQPGGEA